MRRGCAFLALVAFLIMALAVGGVIGHRDPGPETIWIDEPDQK